MGLSQKSVYINEATILRRIIPILLFIITLVLCFMTIRIGNRILMIGLIGLPFALIAISYPKITLTSVLILNASGIPVPQVPGATIGIFAQLIFAVTFVLGILIGQRQWKPLPAKERKYITMFMWLVLLLIFVRGAGLRILGSVTWGGTVYIALLLSGLMYYMTSGFVLSQKFIRWIIWGGFFATIIGTVVGYNSGWAFSENTHNVIDQGRLSFLTPLFTGLFPIALIANIKNLKIWNIILLVISFGIIALTGFRSYTIAGLGVLLLYGFFKMPSKGLFLSSVLGSGFIVWALLYIVSPYLPIGIQRSISFLPAMRVPDEVLMNGATSVAWRVEIWNYCLEYAKEFLLIGRGVTYNVADIIANTTSRDIYGGTTWFRWHTHAYHSGPLTLLVDFGIPGLVIHLLFAYHAIKRFWNYSKKLALIKTIEARFALFFCVSFIWDIFHFYFIFGSVMRISYYIFDFAVASVFAHSAFKMHSEALKRKIIVT